MPWLRTHPGEILAEEYLKPLGLSASTLAQAIGVPGNRISDIIRGRRDVSADTAIRPAGKPLRSPRHPQFELWNFAPRFPCTSQSALLKNIGSGIVTFERITCPGL